MKAEIARRLEAARGIAELAGELLARHFRRLEAGQVAMKGRRDLVTAADLASEELIGKRLAEAFPGDGLLAEEGVAAGNRASPWLWVVDPLDGTTNFVHGFPHFSVSIGLWLEERPLLGVVRDPCRGETYVGLAGGGAFREGEALRVSETAEVRAALLCTGFAYGRNEPGAETNLERFGRALMACQGIRRTGCASLDLCFVAAGALDGYWEIGLAPYDLGAGAPIVLGAGGRVTDLGGGAGYFRAGRLAASNGRLHAELLALVGDGRPEHGP